MLKSAGRGILLQGYQYREKRILISQDFNFNHRKQKLSLTFFFCYRFIRKNVLTRIDLWCYFWYEIKLIYKREQENRIYACAFITVFAQSYLDVTSQRYLRQSTILPFQKFSIALLVENLNLTSLHFLIFDRY